MAASGALAASTGGLTGAAVAAGVVAFAGGGPAGSGDGLTVSAGTAAVAAFVGAATL